MISFRELLINAKNGDEKALMEMFTIMSHWMRDRFLSAVLLAVRRAC